MLTDHEKRFIADWEVKRLQKKRGFNFGLGLRLGAFMVLALLLNLATGWHKKAAMAINGNASVILVIVIASVAIVVFMSVFSQQYQWEQKEQRYQELKAKQNISEKAPL